MSYFSKLSLFEGTFSYPPSVQSELFGYLKPEQQTEIRSILRVLKKPAQVELCYALLDYLESGDLTAPQDFTLASIFNYLTSQWSPLH